MTAECAGMLAVVGSAAHFPARMRQIVSIDRRIFGFPAEAEVVARHFLADGLTGDAAPLAALGLGVVDPSFDAVEVLDVEAVAAVPG
jgi:hypothetical protein